MSADGTTAASSPQAPESARSGTRGTGDNWRELLYLDLFLNLSIYDREIERRERVWIQRFVEQSGKPQLQSRMDEILRLGRCDPAELDLLIVRARAELTMGEKRRFIFNVAQLYQSKGALSTPEYEKILNVAISLGVPETEADAMLGSVYRVNETFIAILGLLASGIIIYLTRSVIIPLVIAIFVSMIINRVDRLVVSTFRMSRPRWFTKVTALVLILGALFGLLLAAVVSGTDIVRHLSDYQSRLTAVFQQSQSLQRLVAWLEARGLLFELQQLPVADMVGGFVASLLDLASNFVLVVIFTGFLSFSSTEYTGVMAEMNKKVGTYVATKSLVCLITGVVVYLVCVAFGIDFALFWGLLAFLLNFIPVVGSIIVTVPPILLAVIQLDSWTLILAFTLTMIFLNTLLGQVVEPKLMGARLAMNPVAVLLGLIFWGLLWGIPGMFLATPLMLLMRVVASHFNISRGFERLLSVEPE